MANVSVSSISTHNGTTTLHGTCVSGGTVKVMGTDGTLIKDTMAAGDNSWRCSFPSDGISTVEVDGGGRDVTVDLKTGVVSYAAYQETLAIQDAV